MSLLEFGQPSHQKTAEGFRGRDADDTFDAFVAAGNPPFDGSNRSLGVLGERNDPSPGFGEHQAFGGAREQARAEGRLQSLNPAADSRVPDMQIARGSYKAAGIGDRQKIAQIVPVETVHSCTYPARL